MLRLEQLLRSRVGVVARASLPLLALTPIIIGSGFRSDELHCEEAVATMASCCPELEPLDLDCTYDAGGCGPDTNPVLTEAEADCIRSLDCDEIRDQQICERVMARDDLQDASADQNSEDALRSEELPTVCQ